MGGAIVTERPCQINRENSNFKDSTPRGGGATPPYRAPPARMVGEFLVKMSLLYRTRAVMRPFAACERLRLLAPEAPGAHQAPRRGFAASWRSRKRLGGGSRRQRELAAPESLARRRTRSVRPEGPPPPPAETSSRLEMVLLCPFGMSHMWAREVYVGHRAVERVSGFELRRAATGLTSQQAARTFRVIRPASRPNADAVVWRVTRQLVASVSQPIGAHRTSPMQTRAHSAKRDRASLPGASRHAHSSYSPRFSYV